MSKKTKLVATISEQTASQISQNWEIVLLFSKQKHSPTASSFYQTNCPQPRTLKSKLKKLTKKNYQIAAFSSKKHFGKFKLKGYIPVVLKLVGSIEPNRCHASIHQTLNYNQ